jgi:hypothetical protein
MDESDSSSGGAVLGGSLSRGDSSGSVGAEGETVVAWKGLKGGNL